MRGLRSGCAWSHENIDVKSEQFSDQRRNALRLSVGVAFFEQQVAPHDISQVRKSLTESGLVVYISPANAAPDVADPWHHWLLRVACERQGGYHRSAEKRDKIAAFHSVTSRARYRYSMARNSEF
ncbi:hypothetical protein A1D31_31475 [Bradyrhizobium liaoningense]|nr:hypothetical protein A1D31_31475 [Bradyrhizobium liaoningense]